MFSRLPILKIFMAVLALIALNLLPSFAQEQRTQTVTGRVINKDTREPLPSATVIVLNITPARGANTDTSGFFRIPDLPLGRIQLQARYPGFDPAVTDNLVLSSAKELEVEIEMTEQPVQMDEVQISAARPNEAVNPFTPLGRSFSVDETYRYAGTVNDPSRLVAGFPGVQFSADNNSDLVVRGNSPYGILWRLEGIDIPNPNHFARPGSSGGGITIFSAQLLGNSDFSTAAFPAEYGNAFSGVFDMRFRKGSMESRSYRFRLGLIGIDLAAEGPIKKGRSSYLVNYRYSTLGILNAIGFRLVGERISNNFQDLSFNLAFNSKDNKTLWTLFGIGGLSREFWEVNSDSLDYSKFYRTETDFNTRMAATGVTFTRLLSHRAYVKAVLAVMGDQVSFVDDTLDIRNWDPVNGPPESELARAPISDQDYRTLRVSTHIFYQNQVNRRFTIKTGSLFTLANYDFNHLVWNRPQSRYENQLQGAGNTALVQPYVQTRYWLVPSRLELLGGVHGMFLFLNNTWSIEPRATLTYHITPQHKIYTAGGLHSAMQPGGNYFTRIMQNGVETLPNRDLDFNRAIHALVGYEFRMESGFRLVTEAYYQYLYDIPVTSDPSTFWFLNQRDGFADRALVNGGKGRNYGIELTFEKYFAKQVFFLATGSLYRSEYLPSDGVWRPGRYDGGYNTSLMGGWELPVGRDGLLQLGARIVANGGLRYTPADSLLSAEWGVYQPDESLAWNTRAGDYFRLDARIAWQKSFNKMAMLLSLDVQNLTNRQNPRDEVWDDGLQQVAFRYQSGMIPVLSVQFDF